MALVLIVGTWKKCFSGFSEPMFIFVGDKRKNPSATDNSLKKE